MDKTMVSVPVEPTQAMIDAARNFSVPGYCIAAEQWPRVWAAMLSAAPAPQPVQGEAVQITGPDHIADERKMVAAPGDVEQHIEALRRMLADEYSFDEGSSPIFTQERAALGAAIAALRSQGQADAVELRSVRDTLIVAANNPVSHGGLGGLRELMLTQAHRITAALDAAWPGMVDNDQVQP